MPDTFTPTKRSEIMSRIRSRGNLSTELALIAVMRRNHITGWRRKVDLPGRPDFVFPKERVAVFVDGDFWHGNPRNFRLPKSNIAYWNSKIASNIRRDRKMSRLLRSRGWRVVRIWESALISERAVVRRLRSALLPRSSG